MVFPGDAEGVPLQDITRFWENVRAKAEPPGVHIYNLRSTFTSLLVSGGILLLVIGKLFGQTQVQRTQRCAHLLDGPVCVELEQVGETLRAKPKLVECLHLRRALYAYIIRVCGRFPVFDFGFFQP